MDITAYRPHKPSQPQTEVCESVAACIPDQPTIEQLISEWKQKDCVVGQEERKLEEQQVSLDNAKREADEAKKSVDDALLAAGYFVGGTVVESDQPAVTDWRDLRVGDVIWWSGHCDWGEVKDPGEYEVTQVESSEYQGILQIEVDRSCWLNTQHDEWKFIRRP